MSNVPNVSCGLGMLTHLLSLVVFVIDIDRPNGLLVEGIRVDRGGGFSCGEHRMILVVVAMHAIATDKKQVVETIGEISNLVEAII